MADTIKGTLNATWDADTVSREVTYSIDGGPSATITYPINAPDEIEVPQNSKIEGSIVDIDDGGNRSLPTMFSIEVTDTFPPTAPGEVGFTATGETEG